VNQILKFAIWKRNRVEMKSVFGCPGSGVQRCSAHLATAPELQVEVVKARRSGGVAPGLSLLCFLCAGRQAGETRTCQSRADTHPPHSFIHQLIYTLYSLCALLIVCSCEHFRIPLTGG
jgi:hypothetical protein